MIFLNYNLTKIAEDAWEYKSNLVHLLLHPGFCNVVILDGKLPRMKFGVYESDIKRLEEKTKETLLNNIQYLIECGDKLKQIKEETNGKEK
jgi:hypothetical protein